MEWDTAISLLALYSYWPSPLLKFLPIFPTPLLQVSYASLLASLSLTRIHGDRKHHFSKFKKKKKSRKLRKKTEFQEVMKQGMLHIHNAVTAFSALQWWNYLGQKKKKNQNEWMTRQISRAFRSAQHLTEGSDRNMDIHSNTAVNPALYAHRPWKYWVFLKFHLLKPRI